MALLASYQSFIARPSTDALAADATIHYVPTLSSITGPSAIVKHYAAQAAQLVKRNEKILDAFESADGLCVETETTIEFVLGGGTFLPGLDDNFVADKTATLPVIHVVSFDAQQKILKIRIFWDQGSLLKGIQVIGRSGHTWPIRDGAEQCRLLGPTMAAASGGEREGRSRFRGGANGDKYTTLQLFQPREFVPRDETPANPVAPRPTAKPADRDYHDLFAAGANVPLERAGSPTKNIDNHLKSGAGKGFGANRLFDEDEPITSPTKATQPNKYDHFEFGEADPAPSKQSSAGKKSKHTSQWDFEDFVTPSKPPNKVSKHNERHFGWSDDEEDAAKPTVHLVHRPQPRPDAAPHFDFVDDTPTQDKTRPAPKDQHGLYTDHVIDNSESPATATKMPLGNITNQAKHNKTFSSHFNINNGSPMDDKSKENRAAKKVDPNTAKVVETMSSKWDAYDESPQVKQRGITIAGDGMGSRKAPGEKSWWETDDSPQPTAKETGINIAGDGMGSRKAPGEKPWWEFE